ncbi:uncharacterized protein LOC132034585 [Lycium ferocissimum]|uniref:uncharacterized protein LOC132034585 n=1 Tax=Lycium ferocissimum TaxID=112874 RepID=UPI00281621FC|nr:uncharacterized protein LOC132034585 [Lycium ferocissimum]
MCKTLENIISVEILRKIEAKRRKFAIWHYEERVSETGASEREETHETSQVEVSVGHEEERDKNEQSEEQQEDKENEVDEGDDEVYKDEETREETEKDNEKSDEGDEKENDEGDEGGEEDEETKKGNEEDKEENIDHMSTTLAELRKKRKHNMDANILESSSIGTNPNRPSIDEVVKSFNIEKYGVRMPLNENNDLSGDIVVKSSMGKGFDKFRGILQGWGWRISLELAALGSI